MKDQFMRDAVDAGLDFFRFSLIGYNKDKYIKWMNKDAFKEVYDNIVEMKKYVTETDSNCDVATYSLIEDYDNRFEEVEAYKNLLEPHGIHMEIWMMHNWSGVYNPTDKRNGQQKTCGRPFSPDIVIRAGGNDGHKLAVHPCCQVLGNDSVAVLGHLDTNTIEEVWNGKEYNELRDNHLSGNYPSYCVGCDFLIDDTNVLVYTNYDRELNKMHGTEFDLDKFREV